MDATIEIRVKTPGRPWTWEVSRDPAVLIDTSTMADYLVLAPTSAILKSLAIAAAAGVAAAEGVEVRWNWTGSLQGHYTGR